MDFCNQCGAPVKDGEILCESCRRKQETEAKEKESYLDDLLHTMEAKTIRNRKDYPQKGKKTEGTDDAKMSQEEKTTREITEVNLDDLFPEEEIDLLDDWDDIEDIADVEDISDIGDLSGIKEDMELEEDLSGVPGLEDEIDKDIHNSAEDLEQEMKELADHAETDNAIPEDEEGDGLLESLLNQTDDSYDETEENIQEEAAAEDSALKEEAGEDEDLLQSLLGNEPEENNSLEENDNLLESLLGEEPEALASVPPFEEEAVPENEAEPEEEVDSDLMDLLGMLGEEEDGEENSNPIETVSEQPEALEDGEDIFSLDDFSQEPENTTEALSDMGDVLSDSLSAVTAETDSQEGMAELDQLLEEDGKKKKERKSIKSFFQGIFGNIHDEKAEKQKAREEEKEKEKAAKKEEKLAAKKPKKKKGDPAEGEEGEPEGEEKKEKKKKEKKEKKEKKPKEKKVKEAVEEVEVDEGRINRAGAAIVFVLFAAITIFLIIGTNSFNYKSSIESAANYFDIKKYTNAYNEIRGLNVKKKDIEIYDKIMTVMYVNKQLNSYHNYYALKLYPEALDSLLKGLERYDKYISTAEELGIASDLNYVRGQLLTELADSFDLSEEAAYDIINTKSKDAYSHKVVEAAGMN